MTNLRNESIRMLYEDDRGSLQLCLGKGSCLARAVHPLCLFCIRATTYWSHEELDKAKEARLVRH